jgi:hypothetical protein
MKKLIFSIIILLSMHVHADVSNDTDFRGEGFIEIQQNNTEKQNYDNAKVLAIKLIKQASSSLNEEGQSLGLNVIEHLKNTKILVSSNNVSEEKCLSKDYSLFVNSHFFNDIFVCSDVRRNVMEASKYVVSVLAQGFIHEGVHLTQNHDECVATLYERTVMKDTIGIQDDGSYKRYYDLCKNRW